MDETLQEQYDRLQKEATHMIDNWDESMTDAYFANRAEFRFVWDKLNK